MPVIKLGDLTTFEGDASGSWLVMNDPTNTATYKVQREQLMSGSTVLSASYALTASYLDNYVPPFPYTGSAEITGSLILTGSLNVTGSLTAGLFATTDDSIIQTILVDSSGSFFKRQTPVLVGDTFGAALTSIKGVGRITIANGSATVTGVGTNFTDSSYSGISYWYTFWVYDGSQWHRAYVSSVANNTSLTANLWYNQSQIQSGYLSYNSTYQGASGTYEFYVVKNYANNHSFAGGNNVWAENWSFVFGGHTTVKGINSFSSGQYNINSGNRSAAIGQYINIATSAAQSFAGGGGTFTSGTPNGAIDRRIFVSGSHSFIWSQNNSSQTAGHGVLSNNSAILGGLNHNIPVTSPRVIVLGGNAIKADENRPDTVYVPNLQVTGSSFVRGALTVTGSTNLQSVTASSLLTTGTITAQTLVVQTITSSVDFVTGSTRFGTQLTDTHQFTGSVSITGSLTVNGPLNATSSWALNALTASYVDASSVVGLNLSRISTGSVTASVNVGTASFQLTSGSSTFLFISSSGNVGIGTNAPSFLLDVSGSDALINGVRVGRGASNVSSNTVVGSGAGSTVTAGSQNSFVGFRSGFSNSSGASNSFFGYQSGEFNQTGNQNSFFGVVAGNVSLGSNNSFFGHVSAFNVTSGNNNSFFGQSSGRYINSGANLTVINNSILIGQDTRPNADSETNQIVIGYQGRGLGSNTTVIGNSSTITTWLGGNLLIGTTTGSGYRATISGSGASGSLNVDNTLYVSGSRVGIGTTAASASLDVSGSARITANLTASRAFLSSSNGTASGSTLIVFGSGSTQPVFTVQGSQGELFSVTDSLSGSLFSVNDVSGLPVIEAFSDNTLLIGSYQAPMLTTTVRTTLVTGSNVIYRNIPTASYDAVFFEYSLRSGSNARAGNIMGIWSGSDANYNEVVTADYGDTTGVKFMVMVTGSNIALTGSAATANWTMKTIVRSI